MEVRKVHDLGELTEEVDRLIRETNYRWWFRGHARAEWDLLPSVRRGYTREQERYLSNEFFVRAKLRHPNCPPDEDFAGWLSLMQHYGLPTRLLDWTRSPLVAAFFATESCRRQPDAAPAADACIWALAPGLLNVQQGYMNYLYPINAYAFGGLLKQARKENRREGDITDKVAAAMAVETDMRMLMQQGAFTIHASEQPLNHMDGCGEWLRKYLIPADRLARMAWELEILGFRLGDLFPDLANLATELKGAHRPKAV
jgi:hypothetical protein